jgi:hypothetical protein
MKMKLPILCLTILGLVGVALAAPELPITKPPVVSGSDPYTGPTIDPTASQGQWFTNPANGYQFPLPDQFYDNPQIPPNSDDEGGGSLGTNAITGVVTSLTTVGGNITAFSVQATVTYDLPGQWPWPSGSNLHGETLTTTEQTYSTIAPTLTANFAISSDANVPSSFTGPYVPQSPQIVATNETLLGWYCWTPGHQPDGQSAGGYYVPAWNNFVFNGTSWVDTLSFTVDGAGLVPSDPRAEALEESYTELADIFTSQSSALKISNWESSIYVDPGVSYGTDSLPADMSDVSVFVPEPTALTLLGMGALSLLAYGWRRRTK